MITKETMHPGFVKYHLNRNGEEDWPFSPVIHHLSSPDTGDPHDHPFDIDILVLKGGYLEEVYDVETWDITRTLRKQGDHFTLPASRVHRIVELRGACWTFCQYGPWQQVPGFWRMYQGRIESRKWNEAWSET